MHNTNIKYLKYLKYKKKYLELKKDKYKQLYIIELKKLYPECLHDETTIKDGDKYYKDGYATTYGEMNYEGIELLNNKLNFDNKIKYFIDFGSGRGKLPLYMANFVYNSIGIELVVERHNDAIKLKNILSKNFEKITDKVELINCDMFKYLECVKKNNFNGGVLIWISNLCFSQELTKKLFDELVIHMPKHTIIASSKIPNILPIEIEPILFNNTNKLDLSMSWSKNSQIFLYKITK